MQPPDAALLRMQAQDGTKYTIQYLWSLTIKIGKKHLYTQPHHLHTLRNFLPMTQHQQVTALMSIFLPNITYAMPRACMSNCVSLSGGVGSHIVDWCMKQPRSSEQLHVPLIWMQMQSRHLVEISWHDDGDDPGLSLP